MSKQIRCLLNAFYSVFDVNGSTPVVEKHAKRAGAYSSSVSTVSRGNIARSSSRIGNTMRIAARDGGML